MSLVTNTFPVRQNFKITLKASPSRSKKIGSFDVSVDIVNPSTKEANRVWGYFVNVDKPVLKICPPTSRVTMALSLKSVVIFVRWARLPEIKCDAVGDNDMGALAEGEGNDGSGSEQGEAPGDKDS